MLNLQWICKRGWQQCQNVLIIERHRCYLAVFKAYVNIRATGKGQFGRKPNLLRPYRAQTIPVATVHLPTRPFATAEIRQLICLEQQSIGVFHSQLNVLHSIRPPTLLLDRQLAHCMSTRDRPVAIDVRTEEQKVLMNGSTVTSLWMKRSLSDWPQPTD